jgi:hypothetical protein
LSVARALAFAVASTVTSMMGAALVLAQASGYTVTYAVAGAVVPAAARAQFGFLTSGPTRRVDQSGAGQGLASVSLRAVFASAALALLLRVDAHDDRGRRTRRSPVADDS